MVNKKGFVWLLFLLSGCNPNGIDWRNRMGAGSSRPSVGLDTAADANAQFDAITGVMARVATMHHFIQAIIYAHAADNACDMKHFATCIGGMADQVSIEVASIASVNVCADAVDAANVCASVRRARAIASQVRDLAVDRTVVACVLLAAITANRNFFAEGYTILSLIHAIRSLFDARVRAAAQGHAILSLIHAVELLTAAAESLIDTSVHAADALATVALRAAHVAFHLRDKLFRMLVPNAGLVRANNRMLAG